MNLFSTILGLVMGALVIAIVAGDTNLRQSLDLDTGIRWVQAR